MIKICVCFLLLLGFLIADDWPNFLGPNWNGISEETNISKNWNKNIPTKDWEISIGVGYSGVAVVDGLIYTAYGKGIEEYCIAIDLKGKVVWKKAIGPFFVSNIGSGPRATPTIHDGNLYIVSANGNFHCLNAKSGKTIWVQNILRRFKAENLKWGMCSSPVVYKKIVLYNVGGTNGTSIVALNKDTGKTIWKSGNDIASYATPLVTKLCGEDQAIFFTGYGLVAVNPNNGKQLWNFKWPVYKNATTPICHGNYVFFSSSYGKGGSVLLEITKKTNGFKVKTVWKNRRFKNHYTTSILYNNYIYGFHNTTFACISFQNGRKMWTQRGFKKGLIIATKEGYAIVLGYDGNLALIKLDAKNCIIKGTFNPFPKKTNCLVVPTLANGKIYVRDSHRLVCIDISKK